MTDARDSSQLPARGDHPWARFGIELGLEQPDLVTATMPTGNLVNPLTDRPTAGAPRS